MTETPPPAELREEMRGPVMWLTIEREERRNAISGAVLAGLGDAIARANNDSAVRAVVITGAGTRAFCAGADLQSGTSFKFDYAAPYQGFANLFRQARQSTVPLIARVNGACMAGGMGPWRCATWRWPACRSRSSSSR